MFYETHENWVNGERNGFEGIAYLAIFVLFVSMIIMIFYTPQKSTTPTKTKPAAVQQSSKPVQQTTKQPAAVEQSAPKKEILKNDVENDLF